MGKLVPFRTPGGAGGWPPDGADGGRSRHLRVRIRLWSAPSSDARPLREVDSDARRTEEAREASRSQAEADRATRRRRRARVGLLAAVFVAGCLAAVVGDRGYLDGRRARRELAEMERRVAEQEAVVSGLRLQVERLRRDPLVVERIAREQLGLVRPEEVVVLFAEDGEPGPPRLELEGAVGTGGPGALGDRGRGSGGPAGLDPGVVRPAR